MADNTPAFRCTVKEFRLQKGWSQDELAKLVNVRRQAIYDIESGKYLPNTAVALQLARVFSCSVEELFIEDSKPRTVPVRLLDQPNNTDCRLALANVRDELVAVPLQGLTAMPFALQSSDGTLQQDKLHAELLLSPESLATTLLILGCDPALNILNEHIARIVPSIRTHSVFASSGQALQKLAAGLTHAASIHFHGQNDADANIAAVHAALPNTPCSVIGFSLQEEGLMVAAKNPFNIRNVADLADKQTRFVNREQSAALRKLFDSSLQLFRIPPSTINGYDTEVTSHCEGAFHVVCGSADAALGLRIIANAFDLDFVPLAVTRCDLVIPKDLHDHPGISILLDMLQSSRFSTELRSLPGYDASQTGTTINQTLDPTPTHSTQKRHKNKSSSKN